MVPTLPGRIQTRIFLLGTVGVIVTALLTPLLPLPGPLGTAYKTTYLILATVLVLGIVWELVYHLLMQWRWEKDWPSLFGLVTALPEGILVWVLLAAHAVPGISTTPPLSAYLIDFLVVWVCVWLVGQGPMRIPFIRWRFHGGRLI
ncbi:MAG TPA: hypothetical protein VHZ03_26920 [Trebonia sp.]|jgi:hypothetical protein|nr:hypothetical protein [Trebonia sp.]